MTYSIFKSKPIQKAALVFGLISLTSCFTPGKEKQIQSELFGLQTRILQLESLLLEKDKKAKSIGDESNQKIASTTSYIDKISFDLQKIKGDVDRLEVGVKTGELPGSDPEEASIKKSLDNIIIRIETIESEQKEIVLLKEQLLKKIKNDKSKKKAKPKKKASKKITSLPQLKRAFNQKKFTKVASVGDQVFKSQKNSSNKMEALYYFAESLYRSSKIKESALRFNELLEGYPNTKWAAHSRMRLGDSFRRLGDKTTAKIYYEELIEKHPNTTQAQRAKVRLTKL